MEYTVQRLADLAGVSARTLRYYDQIGLLRPARVTDAGYRVYGGREVDTLQQILFYRELELPLEEIAALLQDPGFDRLAALRDHRRKLMEKRSRLETLLQTVDKTIANAERGTIMNDKEKFQGLKRDLVADNEARYGAEIRQSYGDAAVETSNQRLLNLTEEQYADMEKTGAEILRLLDELFPESDPAGADARELVRLHRHWLGFTWPQYTAEAHKSLGDMYVADDRFAAYYDRGVPGKAAFLRDAIAAHCGTL